MIVLSVAHTKREQGAKTATGLYEYEISKAASRACFDSLAEKNIPCAMFELGWFTRNEGAGPKTKMPSVFASLAVEIHCNANDDPRANYHETIYYPGSVQGKKAAECILAALKDGFSRTHAAWPTRTARGDAGLFFLKGATPSVIVEGVFVSNAEQAAWVQSPGGPTAYGLLVAEGLASWWQKR